MENREASVSTLSRRPFRALHVDFVGTWLGYVGGRCLEEEELIRFESVEETACSGEVYVLGARSAGFRFVFFFFMNVYGW